MVWLIKTQENLTDSQFSTRLNRLKYVSFYLFNAVTTAKAVGGDVRFSSDALKPFRSLATAAVHYVNVQSFIVILGTTYTFFYSLFKFYFHLFVYRNEQKKKKLKKKERNRERVSRINRSRQHHANGVFELSTTERRRRLSIAVSDLFGRRLGTV